MRWTTNATCHHKTGWPGARGHSATYDNSGASGQPEWESPTRYGSTKCFGKYIFIKYTSASPEADPEISKPGGGPGLAGFGHSRFKPWLKPGLNRPSKTGFGQHSGEAVKTHVFN
jgi:hypothetical protein